MSGTVSSIDVTMGTDRYDPDLHITACFTKSPPTNRARTEGVDFADIDSAYENAVAGGTIFLKGDACVGEIQETLVFDRSDHPELKLVGGCDCNFVPGSGTTTTLSPCLTIVSGQVTVEAIVLK